MKYAYLFGTNAFIIPSNTITYTDNEQNNEFLRVNSIYHDTADPATRSALSINVNLRDIEGHALKIVDNEAETSLGFSITKEYNRVLVTDGNNNTVLDVHQLDDEAALSLDHIIAAELEMNAPVAVIRIRGNFMLGRLHTEADNEKLFISSNSYATSAMVGHNGLNFTADGVQI